jgi:parallel beta helix pectate lyase-like protein
MIVERPVLTRVFVGAFAFLSAAAAFLAAPSGTYAAACNISITACGCTITAGFGAITPYTIANNLTFVAISGACIEIAASNVVLSGSAHTITGPGSATPTVGFHIDASTKSVFLSNINVTGFGVGFKLDGRLSTLSTTSASSNGKGVIINGPVALVDNFTATSNSNGGVLVNPTANGATLDRVTAMNNTGPGIKLLGVTGANVFNSIVKGNSTFGIWLKGASDNTIELFKAADNAIAGAYLGCHAAGPTGTPCSPGTLPTNANTLSGDLVGFTFSDVSATSPAKQKFGIAIDAGNLRNRVLDVKGTGNGTFDAIDENPNCASNMWIGTSSFGTKSPSPSPSGNFFCMTI